MCAATKNCKNVTKNTSFAGLKSFKVIDVDQKPVTSACYDKQHVCTYLQPFSHYTSQYRQNNVFIGGTTFWRPRSRGTPAPTGMKFCHVKLDSHGSVQ